MHYNISVYKSLVVFIFTAMKKFKIIFSAALFAMTRGISANEFSGEWHSQEDNLAYIISISDTSIGI